MASLVIGRPHKLCNFIEWKDIKVVFKRYASLYFVTLIEKDDNELIAMEVIHHYVESLDRYFGNVCELDLIFNFYKAYFILDEILLSGYIHESSKRQVLKYVNEHEAQFNDGSDDKGDDEKNY